jgi:hypothetical protein
MARRIQERMDAAKAQVSAESREPRKAVEAAEESAEVGKKRARSNWVEEQRQKYKRQKLSSEERKEKSLAKLKAFQASLQSKRVEAPQGSEEPEEPAAEADGVVSAINMLGQQSDEGWMHHSLKFAERSRVKVRAMPSSQRTMLMADRIRWLEKITISTSPLIRERRLPERHWRSTRSI